MLPTLCNKIKSMVVHQKNKNQINGSTFINTTVFVKLFGLNFLEWSRLWLVEEECYKTKIIHIQTQKKGYTVMDIL